MITAQDRAEVHGTDLNHPRGFTIVEALVALGIVSILVLLLLPAVQSARESARRIQCANHMRQLAAAAAGFEESHGTLPPGQGSANQSCLVALLAGIERVSLYSSFNFGIDLYDRANQTAIMTSVSGFLCPSDFNAMPALMPATNYAGNFGGT